MNRYGLLLIIDVLILFALGLVMVFNTTSAEVLDLFLDKDTHYAVIRHILYGIISAGFAYFIYWIGYESLFRWSWLLWAGSIFFLFLVFVPGIGQIKNGAHRWIGIQAITFQPSEFVKFIIPIFYIYYWSRYLLEKTSFVQFVRLNLILGLPILLILVEPDHGSTGIIGLCLILLYYLTAIPVRYWLPPLIVLGFAVIIIAMNVSYVADRIAVYLHPESDLLGKGHQPYQAKIAAGSGLFWGRGIGQSLQKLSYLPEAQNDFIAAIFAEEFGFFGIALLIMLYIVMTYLGFYIASKAINQRAALLAITVTFMISIQAFLNLAVVSGLLPSTGLNLPFFSQGGTSLLANCIGLAILLNIHAQSCAKISSVS